MTGGQEDRLRKTCAVSACVRARYVAISLAIECRYAWNGDGYWWLIFGQAISAIAQVVALLSVPCVSCKWFGWHQRLSATAIGLSGEPRRLSFPDDAQLASPWR